MAERDDAISHLSERLDMLKGEVDTLREAVMKPGIPWYKNASSIVAISALLFSFGTTYVSYVHTRVQDIQSLKTELRSLVQRMASLPKENLEIFKKYSDDATSAGLVSGYINQENLLLARQAAEIVKRLPPDQVSATEYQAIGLAMVNSNNTEQAGFFYQKAIDTAESLDDELNSLRGKAGILFIDGKPEAGRMEYQRALSVFERRPGVNNITQVACNITTELNWALSERTSGFVDLAGQHLSSAERLVSTLPPSPGQTRMRDMVLQAKSQFNASSPGDTMGDTGANPAQFAGAHPAGAAGANPARRRPLPRWLSWLRR
jgi:tetratricopeptide (TPR) repeat protein